MDFKLHTDKEELESTAYIEIGPGPYSGKHWQPGYNFISEDAFVYIEGIISKYFKEYDHYSINDIDTKIILKISEELIKASKEMDAKTNIKREEVEELLILGNVFRTIYENEISNNINSIVSFLREIAIMFKEEAEKSNIIYIMGI